MNPLLFHWDESEDEVVAALGRQFGDVGVEWHFDRRVLRITGGLDVSKNADEGWASYEADSGWRAFCEMCSWLFDADTDAGINRLMREHDQRVHHVPEGT